MLGDKSDKLGYGVQFSRSKKFEPLWVGYMDMTSTPISFPQKKAGWINLEVFCWGVDSKKSQFAWSLVFRVTPVTTYKRK